MSRFWIGTFLLLLIAGAIWLMRDQEPVKSLLPAELRPAPPAPLPSTAKPRSTAPPAGVHKCVRNGEVLYTSEPCAPGSAEKAIDRGAVNVLPAPGDAAQPAKPANASQKGPDKLNEMMGKKEAAEARDQRVDKLTR